MKESVLRITSLLAPPIEPLVQQPLCLHKKVLHFPYIIGHSVILIEPSQFRIDCFK